MPRNYETLQSKILKQLSPNSRKNLPESVWHGSLPAIATEIQRQYRSRPYNTYRDGNRMTTSAIKKQLIRDIDDTLLEDNLLKIDNIIKKHVDDLVEKGIINPNMANIEYNKYLIKNLKRDLLVSYYNRIYGLSGVLEDQQIYVPGFHARGKKKTKKKTKKKYLKQKGGNNWTKCAHKFNGVDFCRKCCNEFPNNNSQCINLCMTPKSH